MKLLFDENLSPKLVGNLVLEFPESNHIRNVGLKGKADEQIWNFAKAQGFAIVSKDTDFRERSFVEGSPPKIIWLDVGNAGTDEITILLLNERQRIEKFNSQAESSLLILSIYNPSI